MLGPFAGAVAVLALSSGLTMQAAGEPVSNDIVAQDDAAPTGPADTAESAAGQVIVPKLTPVVIEILEPLGSKTSHSLQTFQIRLAEPILIEGAEVFPAGATGEGEVVHAKKAGGMGAAGELVLAARWIEHDGQRISLRSMKLDGGESGKSKMDTVHAINVASAATFIPISVIGFFISGGNIEIPAGTLASAKVGAEFEVAAGPAMPVEAAAGSATMPQNESLQESTIEGLQE